MNGAIGVTDEATHRGTRSAYASPSFAHEAVVLIASLVMHDEQLLSHPAVAASLRVGDKGGIEIPEEGFPGDACSHAAAAVAEAARLWVVPLSSDCMLLHDETLENLRNWGIQVELMTAGSSVAPPQ
jgi:hypothetical protein